MRIAVLAETDKTEPRVAATPETVKKFVALGAEMAVAGRRRIGRRRLRRGLRGRRRDDRRQCARPCWPAADVDPARAPPLGRRNRRREIRRAGDFDHGSVRQREGAGGARQGRRDGLRHGVHAAHHPRADDGRAVVAGQSRRLSRGDRRGRRIWPRLPDDDDGGGHRAGGESLHHGRRRRRPAGDRHGAPARRHRHRHRRAAGDQGTGRIARREIHRGRERGVQAGRDRRPATPRKCRPNIRRRRPNSSPRTSPSRTSSSPPR